MKMASLWIVARGLLPALLVLAITPRASLLACPYSIRDSGFIRGTNTSPYRLYVLVRGDDASGESVSKDKIEEWLTVGASAWLEDANVEARVLDVADPGARDALPEGFAIPAELPAAVLVSPAGAATMLPEIARRTLSLDAVVATSLRVVESPLRRNLQKRLVKAWCVVLLVEGTDAAENVRARQAFEAAARSITGQATEMGKVVTEGPELLTVSYRDPEENVVLWSLGLESGGEEEVVPVRAVMLIGRGERRGPLLEGDAVTSEQLLEMFTMLGRSCSCTTDETWLSGLSLPLEWSAETEALVKSELGFDPKNPEALGAIKGVLEGAGGARSFSEAALGYTETFLEVESEDESEEPDAAREMDVPPPLTPMGRDAPTTVSPRPDSPPDQLGSYPPPASSYRVGHGVLLGLSGLALMVLAIVTVFVLRGSRSE